MEEETLRNMAVKQYLQGKDPISIYREIGRSKKWFFKWLRRYRSGAADWYRDQSKAPQSHPRQISPEMRKLIVNVRTQLERNIYAQIGAFAIKWEFKKLGLTPPSDSTINRTLRREGFIKKNSLSSQRGRVSLFHKAFENQPHPSGGSHGAKIYQERWPFLFTQRYRSLQPQGLSPSAATQRRPGRGFGLDPLLEGHGDSRLSPGRQRTLLSGKQSLPPLPWYRPQALSTDGNRSCLHPYRRTLA